MATDMTRWNAFWDVVDAFLWAFVKGDKPVPPPAPAPILEVPTPMPQKTMNEKIYEFAKSCLGKDIAATQNELGCAEAVSYILKHCAVPNFPTKGFLSTAELNSWLVVNETNIAKLSGTIEDATPQPGDIIISPTGTSTKGALHGHVGIVALHGILSNNSMTGLFDEYYTLEKWQAYYQTKLGFPVLFYRL